MGRLLHVEGLHYRRPSAGPAAGDAQGHALVVDELSLAAGEVLGIVGPSGCGKSTLIDLLALLRRPDRLARFELAGHDATADLLGGALERCAALRAAHVGVVLQTGGLLPSLSVQENVLLSQRLLGRLDTAWAGMLLAALDLKGLEQRRPSQLSIGQRQRVAIARALAHRPSLVLADEPTASLGVDHAPAALDLLVSLARESGAALVVVSHDLALLASREVPRRSFRLEEGRVRLQPAPVAVA